MVHDTEPSLQWKFHSTPVLDVKAATDKIRKGESSHTFQGGELGLVSRYDAVQVASNSPIEDVAVSSKVDVGNGQTWHAWAIYDGHSGRQTAAVLAHSLIPYVERSLQAHFKSPSPSGDIDSAIIAAFTSLDDEIIADGVAALGTAKSHAEVQARVAPSYAGSCALLVLYDPVQSVIYVANAGDSRAVLGSRTSANDKLESVALSTDHTPYNAAEAERIKGLHPDEPNLITKRDGDVSSEDAVYGVGKWLESVKTGTLAAIGSGNAVSVGGGPAVDEHAERISFWEYWKTKSEWFVYEDDNAATHLVKNAFGGRQRQLFTGVMTVDTPVSKTMRDDVTVQVVFFGEI
ncbi:hypothetical protein UA08_00696 [Talaromyces atroroseus]|uniref:PPM-type phosphatase domain-containing protein n=1 Tax=Talaromyces atroroseus TaxID=1441469 RepID=A0A225AQ71_TALAT|nr:hypothetical protein UA08_00696 [Talaromyces atroroseus]OKL63771.1 hypothetical protein UA08_00696 [Talaromyces atroroseus]